MPITTIGTFSVQRLQILDEKGNVDKALEPKLSNDILKKIYYQMISSRAFDDKCINLQRQGKIGTYAPVRGHEAVQIGTAFALESKDWLFTTYRDSAVLMARGLPASQLIQYWAGNEAGNDTSSERNNFPIAIAVGTQLSHAVGAGYAFKLRGERCATAVLFGDGATSEGDSHDAFNFAGVLKTPTVFICENNQFAISVPRKCQTAANTIVQKSIAYGIKGIQVDGNDALAVYKAVKDALENARAGNGPTLIECETFRMGQHTTSDDPTRYMPKELLEEWKKRDPIIRFEGYLKSKGILNDNEIKNLKEMAEREIKNAVEKGLTEMQILPSDIFKYTFAEMPKCIEKQMREMEETIKLKNG